MNHDGMHWIDFNYIKLHWFTTFIYTEFLTSITFSYTKSLLTKLDYINLLTLYI